MTEYAEEYTATQAGTWPDGKSFAVGDRVPLSRIPEAERAHLIRRGVFVPVEPADAAPADEPPKRQPPVPNKRITPGANKGQEGRGDGTE